MDNPNYPNQDVTAIDGNSSSSSHTANIQRQCDNEISPTNCINQITVLGTSLENNEAKTLQLEKSFCNTENHANLEAGHQSVQADLDSGNELTHDGQGRKQVDGSESQVISLQGTMSGELISFDQILEEDVSKIVTTADNHDENEVVIELGQNNQAQNENTQYDIKDEVDRPSQFPEQDQGDQTDSNQFQQAEEIVKKLCKNGKVMQFHEGDDFIKVIVYEDSAEAEDTEETESAEEFDNVSEREEVLEEKMGSENDGAKNLLDCLMENEKGKRHIESDYRCEEGSDPFKRPRTLLTSNRQTYDVVAETDQQKSKQNVQWCQSVPFPSAIVSSHTMTQASTIQSNFNQTVDKFGNSFMTCNVADLEPVDGGHGNQAGDKENESRIYTPHPKNGYMYYVSEDMGAMEGLYRTNPLTDTTSDRANLPQTTPRDRKSATSQTAIHLNSSGEENVSPSDLMDTPTGPQCQQRQMQKKIRSLIQMPEYETDELGKLREQHNQKERKRRARIKEACNLLRQLVPGMSDKTDKATVFEFAARYVHFLKSHTGSQFDTDFLMKYSPY